MLIFPVYGAAKLTFFLPWLMFVKAVMKRSAITDDGFAGVEFYFYELKFFAIDFVVDFMVITHGLTILYS
jgi:hypothetical protein